MFLPRPFPLGKGRGQHAVIKRVEGKGTPKNLSCDWSTRFMRVIMLGLSLVGTNLQYRRMCTVVYTKVESICTRCVQ